MSNGEPAPPEYAQQPALHFTPAAGGDASLLSSERATDRSEDSLAVSSACRQARRAPVKSPSDEYKSPICSQAEAPATARLSAAFNSGAAIAGCSAAI